MNTKYSEEQGDGSFMKHLILASGSPRRRELMSQVGLDFTVVMQMRILKRWSLKIM